MSALPARKNFKVWKGSTFRKLVTIHTGPSTATPLKDLTGYSGTMTVYDATGNVLYLMTEVGGLVFGGPAGTIELVIDSATTGGFTWTTGRYQLLIQAPSAGDTSAILHGGIAVVTV